MTVGRLPVATGKRSRAVVACSSRNSAAGAGIRAASGDVRSLLLVLAGEDSLAAGLEWQDEGLCAEVDPEIFYQELGGTSAAAKSVCAGCSVRRQCLLDALRRPGEHETGGYGVWGGTSPQDRKDLLARFRGDAEAAADFALRDEPAPSRQEIAA